jgi:hypothetical protein
LLPKEQLEKGEYPRGPRGRRRAREKKKKKKRREKETEVNKDRTVTSDFCKFVCPDCTVPMQHML